MADVILYVGYDENNYSSQKTVPVKVLNGALVFGVPVSSGTDRSATVGTGSVALMGANLGRRLFYVKNDSAINIWINPSATAVATPGGGNIKVPAGGGYFECEYSSGAWSVIAESAGASFTAREF